MPTEYTDFAEESREYGDDASPNLYPCEMNLPVTGSKPSEEIAWLPKFDFPFGVGAKPAQKDQNSTSTKPTEKSDTKPQERERAEKPSDKTDAKPGDKIPEQKDRVRRLGGSDGPLRPDVQSFREQLRQAGINPDRTNGLIGIYEPIYPNVREHPQQVDDVIRHRENGLAPEARTRIYSPRESTPEMRPDQYLRSDNPIAAYTAAYFTAAMDDMTRFIRDEALPNRDMRVLNVSQGFSPVEAVQNTMRAMQRNPEAWRATVRQILGQEQGDTWVNTTLEQNRRQQQAFERGEAWSSNETREMRRLTDRLTQGVASSVETTLRDNRQFNEAMQRYRDVTQQAAERGLTIVVAAGNDGLTARFLGARMHPGSSYNLYAMSDHVIAVGASDNQNTPGQVQDDTVWAGSSAGYNRYHPTVLAQGARLPNAQGRATEIQGTSFAAPMVSATIGLMLEQNPNLSFSQIRQILMSNTTRISGAPETRQGAGVVNVPQAVIAAQRSRR